VNLERNSSLKTLVAEDHERNELSQYHELDWVIWRPKRLREPLNNINPQDTLVAEDYEVIELPQYHELKELSRNTCENI